MIRNPAVVPKSARIRESLFAELPAPVGGWNARDSLAAMGKADAVKLQNFFPRTTYCELRGGVENHVTGLPLLIKTLVSWNGPAGTNKMFGSTISNIYNTTTAGAVGASVATCTSGKWQWINYAAVSGTHYLIMVNGQDEPLYYDGTTWISINAVSTPALTGLTTTNIVHVNLYKHRLFFLEKDKLNFWYLPVQQVGGALTEFILGSLAPRGGYTMAMATWTIDAGEGADDYAVFLTSEGEAIVFRGTNPSDVTTWAHVGTYFIGKPLGRNCFMKLGGDMVVLTEQGVYTLSSALLSATIDRSKALTDKIIKAFNEAAGLYGSNFGWRAIVYPAQAALIVNIPVSEGGEHKQYVMNTISKAWCEFSDWDAESFIVFNGQLYFSTGTIVAKAWSTRADFGLNIIGDARTAFHWFGPEQKRFVMFRPILMVNGPLSFSVGINVDFDDAPVAGTGIFNPPSETLWDSAVWDVSLWQTDLVVIRDWRTPNPRMGFRASGVLNIAAAGLEVQWAATDFVMESGEIL